MNAKHISVIMLMWSIFLLSPQSASAQDDGYRKMPLQLSVISDIDVAVGTGKPLSYSPGMMIDVGIRLLNKQKDKPRGTLARELYIKPFLGFYKREDYHTALMMGADLTYRATRPSGMFWDFNIGSGYMHLFYNTPVYEYKDGEFERKRFQGYANVVVKGAINVGYDMSHKEGKVPLGFYVGGGMISRYPNNGKWPFHPYIQLGMMYTIKKKKAEK